MDKPEPEISLAVFFPDSRLCRRSQNEIFKFFARMISSFSHFHEMKQKGVDKRIAKSEAGRGGESKSFRRDKERVYEQIVV